MFLSFFRVPSAMPSSISSRWPRRHSNHHTPTSPGSSSTATAMRKVGNSQHLWEFWDCLDFFDFSGTPFYFEICTCPLQKLQARARSNLKRVICERVPKSKLCRGSSWWHFRLWLSEMLQVPIVNMI